MKALTLRGHWAELIASGKKTVETRTWRSSYRGAIAIHAGREAFPASSAIVAVADVVDWRMLDPSESQWALCDCEGMYGAILENIIRLPLPIPCKGFQRLWNVPLKIEQEIMAQLRWRKGQP